MIISLLILCNEVLEVKCFHSSEKMRLLCFLFVCLIIAEVFIRWRIWRDEFWWVEFVFK